MHNRTLRIRINRIHPSAAAAYHQTNHNQQFCNSFHFAISCLTPVSVCVSAKVSHTLKKRKRAAEQEIKVPS